MPRTQANIKPRYEVDPRPDEEVTVTYFERNIELGMNVEKSVKEPFGYMVYFPNGNSIRVRDKDELDRLGLVNNADLIDMDSGDVIAAPQNTSLKQMQQRKPKPRRSDAGGVDANQ